MTLRRLTCLMLLAPTLAAPAAAMDCRKAADEQRLAGVERTNFVQRCEREHAPPSQACLNSATERRLAGAARTSHLRKCMALEHEARQRQRR